MQNYQDNLEREVRELLQKYLQKTVTLHEANVEIPKLLAKMLNYLGNRAPIFATNIAEPIHEIDDQLNKVVIANGRRLSEKEITDINEDAFDVILDTTTNTLKFRKDPSHHTILERSLLKGVGSRRIEILCYLMQHPQRHISIDNIFSLMNQREYISSNTLAKSINMLRKALGQTNGKSEYILTERNLENTHYRYKLNPEWKYLLIKILKNHG